MPRNRIMCSKTKTDRNQEIKVSSKVCELMEYVNDFKATEINVFNEKEKIENNFLQKLENY